MTNRRYGTLGEMGRRLAMATAVVAAGLLTAGGVAAAVGHLQPSNTDVQPVLWFADASPTGGESALTRTDGMVLATVEAAGLTPGNAYTLWWVVFNAPENCSDGACGADDIFNEDGSLNEEQVVAAGIGVGNATGNVARDDGTTELGGRLKRNDSSGAHQVLFPAAFNEDGILLTASGNDAEVHVIVLDHGQARGGRQLSAQMSHVDGGCTPLCQDAAFAVHQR